MQAAYSFLDLSNGYENIIKEKSVRWTSRDLDILEFLLEMKFSSLRDIHSRFFSITRDGGKSSSLRWTRERVGILMKHGFIKIVSHICDMKLYLLTQKGYFFLKNSRTLKEYCLPLREVDRRTFEHDSLVIALRNELEYQAEVSGWISERQLSLDENIRRYLGKEFRPDGLYLSSDGIKTAFELEIARKAKDRYRQKLRRYIDVMTKESQDGKLFDQVHFVCTNKKVLNLIRSETQLYQQLFQFNLASEILERGVS